MAKLVFQMSQSLDGYVDHDKMAPGPALFRFFVEYERTLAGGVYGRGVYELMLYWEEDDPAWNADEREFAMAWRAHPKWVVSRSLRSVGPNATLIDGELEAAVRRLKAERDGEIAVAGPKLAQSLTDLGLIDAYRLIVRPFVLGRGAPFFAGARPPLRLEGVDRLDDDAVRLSYVTA